MDSCYGVLCGRDRFVDVFIDFFTKSLSECFKTMQNSLSDENLRLIIQAQITQCDKTIQVCRLKDRSEQVNELVSGNNSSAYFISGNQASTSGASIKTHASAFDIEFKSFDEIKSTDDETQHCSVRESWRIKWYGLVRSIHLS